MEESEKINLVYIGRVEHGSNKIAHAYLQVETVGREQILSEIRLIFKSKLGQFGIGIIIECLKVGESTYKSFKQLGVYNNEEYLRKWRNRDRAVYDEHAANSLAARGLVDKHKYAIENLRKSYRELNGAQRTVFINRLIIDITK